MRRSNGVLKQDKNENKNISSWLALNALMKQCKPLLMDFSHTVKVATVIFIFWRGSAISSSKEEKSGFIYNLVKS